jgi:hypothetical protein
MASNEKAMQQSPQFGLNDQTQSEKLLKQEFKTCLACGESFDLTTNGTRSCSTHSGTPCSNAPLMSVLKHLTRLSRSRRNHASRRRDYRRLGANGVILHFRTTTPPSVVMLRRRKVRSSLPDQKAHCIAWDLAARDSLSLWKRGV